MEPRGIHHTIRSVREEVVNAAGQEGSIGVDHVALFDEVGEASRR